MAGRRCKPPPQYRNTCMIGERTFPRSGGVPLFGTSDHIYFPFLVYGYLMPCFVRLGVYFDQVYVLVASMNLLGGGVL